MSWSSFSPFLNPQIMYWRTPQKGESRCQFIWLIVPSTHVPPAGTKQQCRHQGVHHVCANTVTDTVTQAPHLRIIGRADSRMNIMEHAVGYVSIHIEIDDQQLTIKYTPCLHRTLCDQLIMEPCRTTPWLTEGAVGTIHRITHQGFVNSSCLWPMNVLINIPHSWWNML